MLHARPDYNRIQDPDEKIPALEPVLLLRGQDKYAAIAAKAYAEAIAQDPDATDEALIISATVFNLADTMEEWPVKKSPDIPSSSEEQIGE